MQNFYVQVDVNTKMVYGISSLSGEVNEPHMIPITDWDRRLIKTTYKSDGTFEGYYIELTSSKPECFVNEEITITAKVNTWDGIQAVNYATPIKFVVEGQTTEVTPTDGEATIPFSSEVPGEFVVKTENEGLQRNGEVKVNVI